MPRSVLEAIGAVSISSRANVHRGVHTLSGRATAAFESARESVARFVHAESADDIVFTSGGTASLNLVAYAWGDANVGVGDEVIVTAMEHHSNFVPWQQLCKRSGATLVVAPINDRGELDRDAFERLLGPKTKVVAITHVSNALGTVNDVRGLTTLAHSAGAIVVIDGVQAAPHVRINVQEIGCDFYAFSGHKMYGPTGIGALWGAPDVLGTMAPHHTGGGAITRVTEDATQFVASPHRFEPGTPNVAGAIGLEAAIDFIGSIGIETIGANESSLLTYAHERLGAIESIRRIGTAEQVVGVCSFALGAIHPHDVATILDEQGVAVQAGHHCAQPVMDHFAVPATVRLSLGVYNAREDIDALIAGCEEAARVMSR